MQKNNKKTINKLDFNYNEIDKKIEEIIHVVTGYMNNVSKEKIKNDIEKAYLFAKNAHNGQFRKSGEPYIIHPVESAIEILALKPDLISIQACFLHDVPEDTPITLDEIKEIFGEEMSTITGGMKKLTELKYKGEARDLGNLRKMFIAISEDIRIIFVKLADRIHNMKTLEFHSEIEKRKKIASETLNIYAPIANRLGLFNFKETLETLCFKHLYPDEYFKIKNELDNLKEEQNIFISQTKDVINEAIPKSIPIIDISFRIKSPYSIYKKMQRKGYDKITELHDIFALRIITDSIPHCYEILGEIHNKWHPIPKRFKDYIALPKENGYQSLHTTIIGMLRKLRTQPTEIQIRTKDMHKKAEIGVAAHFDYSEKGKSIISKDSYWVSEIKNIINKFKDQEDAEFISNIKMNFFGDRIFALSPKGDIINLPKGSTPIDFAYSIHSDLGNTVSMAKINNKIVQLDYELNNGDTVEIITDKNKSPLVTWLSFVKTTRAKEVIKNYINKSNRVYLIEKGKFILNNYLQKNFGIFLDKELSILKNIDGHVLDTKGKEDLLVQIGNLSRKPSNILRNIIINTDGNLEKIKSKKNSKKILKSTLSNIQKLTEGNIIIGGEKNIPFKFASCCEPKKGDKILGYITSRSGLNIHKISCKFLKKLNISRFIQAYWEGLENKGIILIVEIIFENSIGVLNELTDILFNMNINIDEIKTEKIENNCMKINLTLESKQEDYYVYERFTEKIKLVIKEFKEINLIDIK